MSRNSSKQNYTQLMEWLKVNKIRTVKRQNVINLMHHNVDRQGVSGLNAKV